METEIRKCGHADYPALIRLWERSVRATHSFLAESDILNIKEKLAVDYFPCVALTCAETDGVVTGFIGVSGDKIEMLFVDPSCFAKGIGSLLIGRAIASGAAFVDVNEQNYSALAFYKAKGFKIVGRSHTDDAGMPYPILHLSKQEWHIDFRKAAVEDVSQIMAIMRQAVAQMQREGKHQWDETYPAEQHIRSDIEKGYGYVLANDIGEILCYGAVVYDGEPAYEKLDGQWLTEQPYVMVHRLAVADGHKGEGLSSVFFGHVEDLSIGKGVRSFRVDTNYDNSYMLKVLERQRFSYCGKIWYERGERMAFEKLMQ